MWCRRLLNLDREIKRLFLREQKWGMRKEERGAWGEIRSREGYVLGNA
jgi:hypothetical protein